MLGANSSFLAGFKTYKYGPDGYTDFTKPMHEYDLNRARVKIYGSHDPKPIEAVVPPVTLSQKAIRALRFPSLGVLERMLDKLPKERLKFFLSPRFIILPNLHPAQKKNASGRNS